MINEKNKTKYIFLSLNIILYIMIGINACSRDEIRKPWDIDWIFEARDLSVDEIESIIGDDLIFSSRQYSRYTYDEYNYYNYKKILEKIDYLFNFTFKNNKLIFIGIEIFPLDRTPQQYNLELRQHITWLLNLGSFQNIISDRGIEFEIEYLEMNGINFSISFFEIPDSLLSDQHSEDSQISVFRNYRDIPGITSEEISALESIKAQNLNFIYGFYLAEDIDFEISQIICGYLSDLFGIMIVPQIYDFEDLQTGLKSGVIDFTGDILDTDENRIIYYMTDIVNNLIINSIIHLLDIPITEENITSINIFYKNICISTANPMLVPIISIIQKAVHNSTESLIIKSINDVL